MTWQGRTVQRCPAGRPAGQGVPRENGCFLLQVGAGSSRPLSAAAADSPCSKGSAGSTKAKCTGQSWPCHFQGHRLAPSLLGRARTPAGPQPLKPLASGLCSAGAQAGPLRCSPSTPFSLSHTHTHKHTYMPPTPLHQGSPCSQEKVTRGIEEAQTHKGSGFLRSLNFRVWFTTSSYPHFIEPGRRCWPKSQEWNSRDCERDRAGLEPVGSMGCSCSLSWVCGRLLGWPVGLGWGGMLQTPPLPGSGSPWPSPWPSRLPEVPGFLHTQAGPPCHGPSLAMVTSMQRLSGPQTLIEDARKE